MSVTIALSADALGYPQGGGHLWAYLNWALSLRSIGCEVSWLEGYSARWHQETLQERVNALQQRLTIYGLGNCLALYPLSGQLDQTIPFPGVQAVEEVQSADLLLNLRYGTPQEIVSLFRRSALLDIDPGLLQTWVSKGQLHLPRHHLYFSIGETVGVAGSLIPDLGLNWMYTPPCVALDAWPATLPDPAAPFTTVTHWYADEWLEQNGELYSNDKRSGFLPFLELPRQVKHPLELALNLGDDATERASLEQKGWRLRESHEVTSTPWDYQAYIQHSLGEFSCAKPSCLRFQNAWVSDRTLCYLASGRPAIVQHTGPSRFLPDAEGLFRFKTLAEAVQAVETVISDPQKQSRSARQLASAHFAGHNVARQVLELALNK